MALEHMDLPLHLQCPLQWVCRAVLKQSDPQCPGICSAFILVPNDGEHYPGRAALFCPQLLLLFLEHN